MKLLFFFLIIFNLTFAQVHLIDLKKNIVSNLNVDFDTYYDLNFTFGKHKDTIWTDNQLNKVSAYKFEKQKFLVTRGKKNFKTDPEGAYLQDFIYEKGALLKFPETNILIGQSLGSESIPILGEPKMIDNFFQKGLICFQSNQNKFLICLYFKNKENQINFKDYLNDTIQKMYIYHEINYYAKLINIQEFKRAVYSSKDSVHYNYFITNHLNNEIVKDGLWKEFHPNHNLKFIGNFKLGKPYGIHKTFDLNGLLIQEVDMGMGLSFTQWIIFIASILLLFFLFYYIFIKKNNN